MYRCIGTNAAGDGSDNATLAVTGGKYDTHVSCLGVIISTDVIGINAAGDSTDNATLIAFGVKYDYQYEFLYRNHIIHVPLCKVINSTFYHSIVIQMFDKIRYLPAF